MGEHMTFHRTIKAEWTFRWKRAAPREQHASGIEFRKKRGHGNSNVNNNININVNFKLILILVLAYSKRVIAPVWLAKLSGPVRCDITRSGSCVRLVERTRPLWDHTKRILCPLSWADSSAVGLHEADSVSAGLSWSCMCGCARRGISCHFFNSWNKKPIGWRANRSGVSRRVSHGQRNTQRNTQRKIPTRPMLP